MVRQATRNERHHMKFAPKYAPEQWAEARRLRAAGEAFKAIADRLGFASADTIRARARKEGWFDVSKAGAAKAAPRSIAPGTAQVRRTLALRLCAVLKLDIRSMELLMKHRLQRFEASPDSADSPVLSKAERESFGTLIDQINKVTEMTSEPAFAADGRRKSASINSELTALSDDLDAAGLAAASEKDNLRREIADKLEKLLPPS